MNEDNPTRSLIEIFKNYISLHYSLSNPEITFSSEDDKRFLLVPFEGSKGREKYSRISFWQLVDREASDTSSYVIKKNIGIDIGDEITLTGIEAKVLEHLRKEQFQVVDYCGHMGDMIMTKYVPGKTIAEYITENGTLPSDLVISIITRMPKTHSELTRMMEENVGGISEREVDFIKDRQYRLLSHKFPKLISGLKEDTTLITGEESEKYIRAMLEQHFHTYRVMQLKGEIIPGFENDFAEINNTLNNSRKVWIGYDHPQNRILLKTSETAAYRVIAYDFNHIENNFFGLDVAMQILSLNQQKGAQSPDKYNRLIINYINLALVNNRLKSLNPESQDHSCFQETFKRLSDPDEINKQVIPIHHFYNDKEFLLNTVSMYAAFLQRATMGVLGLKKDDSDRDVKAISLLSSIDRIHSLADNLENTLRNDQLNMIVQSGMHLPISRDYLRILDYK
jgi:hypothetical protein